jgi:hypothetical protein
MTPSRYWLNARSWNISGQRYTHAIIVQGKNRYGNNTSEFEVAPTARFTSATNEATQQRRMQDVRSEYEFNSYSNKTAYLVPWDQYVQLVQDCKAGNYPSGNIAEILQGLTPVTELKDKPVFIVWNLTDAQFVRAVPTGPEAEKVAFELAQKNPTKRYLTLIPDSIAYQPIAIKVEKVNLNG